ncbi:DUF2815 family protein [Clostridium sp. 19966]|uniref:DUF2815 family protein n=1 Tax=Clostridium sp. 19966 TaxID=2768166 RepID=UPI0028DF97E8|nr:DUF2815 family protein [Clostridium sp. 19966]MDT8715463.1 DUF2815 family protein [Clostridium sp. 19966]
MSNQISPTYVVTGRVRLSYVHLFTPHASQQGAEPKFSTTILIPKSDIATKQRIDAAIAAAVQQGISGKWNGARPPQIKSPVWDGDGVRQNGEPFSEECKGHWVITASSNQQQEMIDVNMNPIINQTEVYSGMYARVSINFFPFFNSGNKGIGCGLGPVQKLEDGEPLGGRVSAATAFGNAPMPTGYNQPMPTYKQPIQNAYGQAPYVPPAQRPVYQQPNYPQQNQYQQTQYQQPQQQYDPITGAPIGGVMGLNDSVPF